MNETKKLENLSKKVNVSENMASDAQASVNGSIDERLQSPGQMVVRQVVKALPEDMPSLAWRSALNEQLAASVAARQARRRRWVFGGSSFAGLALAAGLALVVFMPKHGDSGAVVGASAVSVAQNGPSLDELLASHNDSVTSQDVVGAGLTSQEVQSTDDDSEGQPTS